MRLRETGGAVITVTKAQIEAISNSTVVGAASVTPTLSLTINVVPEIVVVLLSFATRVSR
jgi:hypothetical protein